MRDKQPLTNLLFLIVEKVNDIPTWFYLNNPYVRTLTISRPEKEVREAVVSARLDGLAGVSALSTVERKQAEAEFVSLTDGMTLVELFGIFSLCRQKQYSVKQIKDAVKMFRYGETESQWDKLDANRVKSAKQFLTKRVKGQDFAVEKTASVLSRACLGMTGIQGGSSSRPKGVLFFAGPTGTGKTELAKTIAEFIFGDDSFVTRFDMSEYQQPHSDQKLLGAPPGYVGYSDGGQLTNAIKAKPFCVLLFDEIDKAHPSILDKFLQILEDGRITDSAGETMYFSEALIIFTSNLGVVGTDPENGKRFQTVTPEMDYEEIQTQLLSTIKDYFKYTIQRPELLNRIGDNFVVFDFIREDAAAQILDLKLNAIANNLEHEKGVKLTIGDEYRKHLLGKALADLSNGGRGIGNMVETNLINPLSNILIMEKWEAGCNIEIKAPVLSADELHFEYLDDLCAIIDKAVRLAANHDTDRSNIRQLGGGWVAEETLAIAIYCALRYEHDFSAGIIAAVNHDGDSDSTGAVTGNILGAINGYDSIEAKWKTGLELMDVLLEMSDDLCQGCLMSEYDTYYDPDWARKYIDAHWKA